jgi:SAM-dependent methyltransferase
MAYRYPSQESETNALENTMDPYKTRREALAIELFAAFDWTRALDYGCGTGRYFESLFSLSCESASPRTLVGIEPDPVRAAAAASRASSLNRKNLSLGKIDAVNSGIEYLDYVSRYISFDLILCAQVLGHISENLMGDLLNKFLEITHKGSRLMILVPFSNEYIVKEKYAEDYTKGQDYYFWPDFSKLDEPSKHRNVLTPSEFEGLAQKEHPSVLPVRSFSFPSQVLSRVFRVPSIIREVPYAFDSISSSARIVSSVIYSVHETDDAGVPLFGDVMLVIDV